MQQFKRCSVVMLSTNQKVSPIFSKIALYNGYKSILKFDDRNIYQDNNWKSKELYILSDEEIKEGDWCYHQIEKKIYQIKENVGMHPSVWKKIIATTDSSLEIVSEGEDFGRIRHKLPQPSQQFIQKFVESYNKGEIITDVLVEYEEDRVGDKYTEMVKGFKLKVNPKDNTITIKKLKNNWNREEVEKLCKDAFHAGEMYCATEGKIYPRSANIHKWVEDNL